jgi:hypothetical protein
MWFGRGQEQSAAPRGSLIELSGKPSIVPSPAAAVVGPADDFRFRNYRLDVNGNPEFSYTVDGLEVTDVLRHDVEGRYFVRTLTVRGESDRVVWCLLAENASVREISASAFDVGDGTYYIELDQDSDLGDATIVDIGQKQRVVAPVVLRNGAAVLRYNIVW